MIAAAIHVLRNGRLIASLLAGSACFLMRVYASLARLSLTGQGLATVALFPCIA